MVECECLFVGLLQFSSGELISAESLLIRLNVLGLRKVLSVFGESIADRNRSP